MIIRVFLIAVAVATMVRPAEAQTPRLDTLTGLWTARRHFGPDVRGPLVIERRGTEYTATIQGWTVPVRNERGELVFALPVGQGSFRGKLWPGSGIRGFWQPSRPYAMGGHSTPVRLVARGADRWIGEVAPYDDVFTFHLLLRPNPDGSLWALLRNTERDWGALLGFNRLERSGDTISLLGRQRGQNRVRSAGWYDAETDVLTLRFPGRGGSYDFRRANDSSGFYPRARIPGSYVYRTPPARDDGWTTGTVAAAGIDPAAVTEFMGVLNGLSMDSANAPQVHSLLIARHGRLVLEEYFHGEHRDKLHDTRSGSKSVVSVLLGAAMHAGLKVAPSTPVYRTMISGALPADLDPRKRAMTLKHLLTMTSGFFCDDNNPEAPGSEDNMSGSEEPDYYRYILNVPMASDPGLEKGVYCSAVSNLALGVVGKAVGESPLYLFERLVAEPLKITRYAWGTDPLGQPFGGGSMQFLPRDYAKFGQLMLNGGTWDGHRVLDQAFIAEITRVHSRLGSRNRGYGYQWWVEEYPHRGGTIRSFASLGAGGNIVVVFPELDLVVAINGGSYGSSGWRYMQAEFIPKHVLPAVRTIP